MTFTQHDLNTLRRAVCLLEQPSLAMRIANLLGSPIERSLALLPASIAQSVQYAAQASIGKALDVAILSLPGAAPVTQTTAKENTHKMLCSMSGAMGGFFGMPGLAVELPVSTTLMLRAIADIARSEGADIHAYASRIACMEVFALGGNASSDDGAESAYYAVRIALGSTLSDALKYIAAHGLADKSAPVVIKLISAIAARFGVTVSQKIAAQLIPAIGAVSGASLNLVFMDHFQSMARGHFIVRRLEQVYGVDRVQLEYQRLAAAIY